MNLQIINNPSWQNWRREIYNILETKSSIDIQKLGNAGVYIEVHFNDTEPRKKEESVKTFFYAFDELLERIITNEILLTPYGLLSVSQIINNFRDNKYYQDTSKMEYVNKLSIILSIVIDKNERRLLEYEKSFYEYGRFLLYFIEDKSKQLPSNSVLTELLIDNILRTYGVFEDYITNLFYYILVKLEYNEILQLKQTDTCKQDLSELYISEQNYNNQLLNDILIDLALKNEQIFFSLLNKFNCEINQNLPTTIIYRDSLENKELNPDADQLKRLFDLSSNYSELAENALETINSLSL